MPNIPISEVPNIQTGPATPLASPNQQGPDLSAARQALTVPTLQQGAFDGAAQGIGALGQSIQRAADVPLKVQAVLQDAQERKTKFQDDAQLAQYDADMGRGYEEYKATLPGTSENEWGPKYAEQFKKNSEQYAKNLSLSPEGQQRLQIYNIRTLGNQQAQLMAEGTRSSIARGTSDLLAQAQRQYDSGQIEEAHVTMSRLVTNGALGQNQADSWFKQQEQQQKQNQFVGLMQKNPKAIAEDTEKLARGESVPELDPLFTGPDRNIQIERARNAAQSNLRGIQTEQRQNIFEGIQGGSITNYDQIEAANQAGGEVLEPRDLQAAKKALMNTVGVLDVAKYNDIRAQVAQYDPKGDKDGTKMADLQRQIGSELPSAEGSELFKRLKGISSGAAKNTDVDSRISQISGDFLRQGLFSSGKYYSDEQMRSLTGKDLQDAQTVMQNANTARAKFDDAYNAWSQAHPGAKMEEGVAWANEYMQAEIIANAAKNPAMPGALDKVIDFFRMPAIPERGRQFINQKGGNWNQTQKPQAMNTTDPVEFVKRLEGFTPKAAFDYKQNSVGYGTRAKSKDETLTEAEATDRLKEELAKHEERVDDAIDTSGLDLTPAQRTALISFDFNTGEGKNLIETSDSVEEIARRMALYTKVTVDGKKVENKGLANRRAAELELFNS